MATTKQSGGLRQRGGSRAAGADAAAQQQQQASVQEELTTMEKLNWYFAQHIGLVFCAVGVAVLALGYDKGWIPNTHLCWVSLVLCLVGLFFHEFRPYNLQHMMEQQQKAAAAS